MVPFVAPSPSPSRSFPRFHIAAFVTLVAILTGLVAPDAARAEVRRRAYLPSAGGVAVQDLTHSVPVPPGYASATPQFLEFSGDGQTMYGLVQSTGDLLVYDLNSQNAPTVHALGLTDATAMVVTPDGTKAYVSRTGSYNKVDIVDLGTMSVIGNYPVNVSMLALSSDGARIFLGTGSSIHSYFTADNSWAGGLVTTITFGSMAVSPDGLRAVVTGSGSVTVVDLVTLVEEETIVPGMAVGKVVITKDSSTALIISNSPINDLVFVNLDNRSFLTMGGALISYPIADIDLEEGGKYAWVHDPVHSVLIAIDIAGHSVPGGMGLVGSSPNGRFLGPLVYTNDGDPNVVSTDADLTAAGFGPEVRVGGTLTIDAGFSSSRTFRFVGAAPRLELDSATITFDGPLTGSGFEVTALSAATLRMTGTSSLSGAIDVGGSVTLQADGTHNGPITLQSGASLSGTGTVGDVTAKSGSSVRPGGASSGILTVDDITFESGSSLILDVNGLTAGAGYDRLVTNTAVIQPNVTLQTWLGFLPSPGDSFTILTNVTGPASAFDGLPGGGAYDLNGHNTYALYNGGTGDDMTLTVDNVPTGSAISNDTIDEDGIYNGAIAVGDDLTPVNSLTVTATSNAQWLVPDANITVGSTDAARFIQITPAANMSGTATITVRVADPHFYVERTFQLQVNSVNDAPTMTAIGAQTTAEDSATGAIAFDVDDVDTCIFNIFVTATSSNQAIVPNANIVVEGDDEHRTVRITPVANAHGTVTITLRAEDDDNSFSEQTFQLTVTPAADPPSIAPIANQTIEQDASSGPIAITITDIDGFDNHTVTASSSNQTLVPNANLVTGGANGARTLTITPAAGQHGAATITVTVNDGTTQASASFTLTVNEAPAPPAITYTLAEGATGIFFDTDLLLANPNTVAAPVTITWLLEGGGTIVESRVLTPMSRTTIKVDEVTGLESTTFSTQVVSTGGHPIAVERTMRWGAGGYGAHTEKAGSGSATTWYFAEGASGWFSTYLLLGNPHATANTATVEWLREGEPVLTRSYELLPYSRTTIDTYKDAELRDRAFGAKVTFDQPGVAERTMYFGADPLWTGGGAAAGQTSLSARWDFAEGATGTYFTTFLLLANPGTTPANVTLTYFPQDGTPVTITDTLAAGRRMTRNIAFEHPSLANAAVASRVESTQPIVAERAQYWGVPEWIESHNSFGVTAPGTRWALAEGRVGGDDEAQTYILLSNPGNTAGSVKLTFLRTDGTTVVKTVNVPAASRFTFGVTGPAGAAPELVNETFGTLIESTQPIIVERSLYSNANGIVWAAGTNATATALPEPQ